MAVRFPDLQVLVPRAAEVSRVQSAQLHHHGSEQHAALAQAEGEMDRRMRQVARPPAPRDARLNEDEAARGRERRRNGSGRRSGRTAGAGAPGQEGQGMAPHLGGQIDLRA